MTTLLLTTKGKHNVLRWREMIPEVKVKRKRSKTLRNKSSLGSFCQWFPEVGSPTHNATVSK
ncbi:hypothetical protein OSB04_015346 [Centaurea solstitialis]|uniref:Uncharacterized protein n=1 Tax=Centaurea solstitialis TaxID=347529 RepID=A0AA38WK20_9ASTR|nr:hypothetical protein OSB04_015346 [Centaurea solstitialis]